MSTITSLWMGDLEPYMEEGFITQAFMDWGEEPINVKMIKNKTTGAPLGYCFVEFRNKELAQKCMLRLNGKNIPRTTPQKRFKLNHASYGGREGSSQTEYSLFVGDLSEEVDDMMLYAAFKRYPSLKTAKVVSDKAGAVRGYGFVRFYTESDQQKALHEMQNVVVGRRPIRVRFAVPKKEQASQLYRQGYPGMYGGYGYDPSAQAYANTQSYYNSWGQQSPTSYQSGSTGQHSTTLTGGSSSSTPGYYNNYSSGSNFSTNVTGQNQTSSSDSQQHDLETLEDPKLEIDIDAENEKYIQESEELYHALHECRWFGMDNAVVPSGSGGTAVAAS